MFQITISVITGITMASWIQKKSQMINRHRDYVPLLLHFHGYIPFQSVCLCVCVCGRISRPFFNRFSSVIHGWTRLHPGQGTVLTILSIIQGGTKKTPLKSRDYCFFVRQRTATKFYTVIVRKIINHMLKFQGDRVKTHVSVAIFVKATLFVKVQSER